MVRHMISVDQRDEAVFPTRGARLHICNELAGLGGSVASLRAELHLQLNYTLSQKLGLVRSACTCKYVVYEAGLFPVARRRVVDILSPNDEYYDSAVLETGRSPGNRQWH